MVAQHKGPFYKMSYKSSVSNDKLNKTKYGLSKPDRHLLFLYFFISFNLLTTSLLPFPFWSAFFFFSPFRNDAEQLESGKAAPNQYFSCCFPEVFYVLPDGFLLKLLSAKQITHKGNANMSLSVHIASFLCSGQRLQMVTYKTYWQQDRKQNIQKQMYI